MGCYSIIAKRRDGLKATAKRQYSIRFYAGLICSVISDTMRYYFCGSDGKQLADKDGRFFAGKEYFNN